MGKPFGMELRERVIAACDQGQGTRRVARRFAVSESWVRRLKQRRRQRGSIAPLASNAGRKPRLNERHRGRLAAWLRREPDLTLAQLRERLAIKVCVETINQTLRRMGLSLKKSRWRPASGGGPT
jgi:transposase